MTATKQDFTSYAGDASNPIFTVVDGSGNPINIAPANISEIQWSAQRDLESSPVITKLYSANQIVLIAGGLTGKFKVLVASGETSGFSGFYMHRAIVTDQLGNVSTVTLGRWQVGPAPTWTYSGDPALRTRDEVRVLIDDIDSSKQKLTDPEVDFFLRLYPNTMLAAAGAARKLATKYALMVNKRVGDLSISYSDISRRYSELARELQAQGDTMGVTPYSGGISRADKTTVEQDTDRMKPPFKEKQFDNRSGFNNTSDLDGSFGDGS